MSVEAEIHRGGFVVPMKITFKLGTRVVDDTGDEGVVIGGNKDWCIFRGDDGTVYSNEWIAINLAGVDGIYAPIGNYRDDREVCAALDELGGLPEVIAWLHVYKSGQGSIPGTADYLPNIMRDVESRCAKVAKAMGVEFPPSPSNRRSPGNVRKGK